MSGVTAVKESFDLDTEFIIVGGFVENNILLPKVSKSKECFLKIELTRN